MQYRFSARDTEYLQTTANLFCENQNFFVLVAKKLKLCFLTGTLKIKQVRTNNDAAFQCNFIFNIFLFYGCYGFFLILLLTFK